MRYSMFIKKREMKRAKEGHHKSNDILDSLRKTEFDTRTKFLGASRKFYGYSIFTKREYSSVPHVLHDKGPKKSCPIC